MASRRAFTLIELLVVITIIGILMSLLLVAISAARAASRRSECGTNLHQLGVAILNYVHVNHGKFPPAGGPRSWTGNIATHLEKSARIQICPEDPSAQDKLTNGGTSYLFNAYLCETIPLSIRNINQIGSSSRTIMVFEGSENRTSIDTCHPNVWFTQANIDAKQVLAQMEMEVKINRHGGSANYLYADGHVDLIGEETIAQWVNSGTVGSNFGKPQ